MNKLLDKKRELLLDPISRIYMYKIMQTRAYKNIAKKVNDEKIKNLF